MFHMDARAPLREMSSRVIADPERGCNDGIDRMLHVRVSSLFCKGENTTVEEVRVRGKSLRTFGMHTY
jgi:hypothetical protein